MRLDDTILHDPGVRRGMTLLEVMIACGLLVMGLSAMAALLPAAGSRLAQANLADRAGVLASNAFAESISRGLVAADVFPAAGSTTPQPARALAIGALVGQLPTYGVLPSGRTADEYFTGPSEEGRTRCGSPRTFRLEDELVYGPPTLATTPVNAFTTAGDGGSGPRRIREGVCWAATLVPKVYPAAPGGAATLTIAVFKRDGEVTAAAMKAGLPVVLTRTNSFYEADMLPSGSLLRACSWILAIPPSPGAAPRWFQIMSSWTFEPPATQNTRLIFRNQQDFEALTSTGSTGSKATVFAFEGLARVDEHLVTLH